ncbi:efflux RND transporter periplasmic adaptor subunit [Patescibacteria group bacterium]
MIRNFKQIISRHIDDAKHIVRSHPVGFLLFAIVLLGLVIFILNTNRGSEIEEIAESPKVVGTMDLVTGPKIDTLAQVQSSNILDIYAQVSGIVNKVNYLEGQTVSRGEAIVTISQNYLGGNVSTIQANIASLQYNNSKDTIEDQISVIDKQIEATNKTKENSDKLRELSRNSVSQTNDLIELNNTIISSLETQIADLESAGQPESVINPLRQSLALQKSNSAQIESQKATIDYSASDDNPPAKLAELQKEITTEQLNLQKQATKLGLEVSRLQSATAWVGASLYKPSSPLSATLERIHVSKNQIVTPGVKIATVRTDLQPTTLVVNIPQSLSTLIDTTSPSIIKIDGAEHFVRAKYLSSVPTNSGLFTIEYELDTDEALRVGAYYEVRIPLAYEKKIIVPIDAVHQTNTQQVVYVVEDKKAKSKDVELGEVSGSWVEIVDGIDESDVVIITRNVVDGDLVTV